MDLKQIQELVKLVNKSNIGELSIEQPDFKIKIKQHQEAVSYVTASPGYLPQGAPQQLTSQAAQSSATEDKKANAETQKAENYITIKSPMIGTFYRQDGPGKPIFVNVGDQIEPGKVICIIEAMKLFNEIESEESGKIVKILVEDASPVEFDQPLFLIEP